MKYQFFRIPHLVMALAIIFIFINCKDEDVTSSLNAYLDAADCTNTLPTYSGNVQSIFNLNCSTTGCHDNSTAAIGLTMEGYDNAKASFTDFDILCTINHDSGCKDMPQGGSKLSDEDILLITCWVKNDYPE